MAAGKKLLFTLVLTAVGLLSMNLGALVYETLPYGVRSEDGQPVGLYEVGAGTGRPQLKKGAHLRGSQHEISINSLGFRGAELVDPKPANGFRIWAVGGSSTFDIFSPDDASTWPAVAAATLQARHPDRTIEVINAGIPGEVFWGNGQDLMRLWRTIKPDVVVVYHGINDLRKAITQHLPPQGHMAAPPLDLAILRVLRRAFSAPRPIPSEWSDRRLTQQQLREVRRELLNFLAIVERSRIPVLMATHGLRLPQQWTADDANSDIRDLAFLLQMPPPAVAESVDLYNDMVQRVARERGFLVADVRGSVPGDHEYWGDACHFSGAGSAIAGETVANALEGML
jgi:lysophospholipase L1-like esterase